MDIKPGMLCYLRKPCFPENIGIVVEARRCLGSYSDHPGHIFWHVVARSEMKTPTGFATMGYVPQVALVPINNPDAESDCDVSKLLRKPETV